MVDVIIKNKSTRKKEKVSLILKQAKLVKGSSILLAFLLTILISGCGVKQKFSCSFYNKDKEIDTKNMMETIDNFRQDCVENPQFLFYWNF